MMKWLGRSIYVLAIVFISVLVYRIAYTAKLQSYYDSEIRDHIDVDVVLLKGLNTLLTIDYYRESPLLYTYESPLDDYQFTISSYAIGITYGDISYDGIMFVINDVLLKEDDVVVANPILKISVNLSDETLLVDKVYSDVGSVYYDPEQPFSIYNVPALFLFDADNYLLVPNEENTFATIETITLEYSNRETNANSEPVFNDIPLFVGSKTEYRDAAFTKDPTFDIDSTLYQIRDNFESKNISDNDIEAFNLVTDQDDLSPYNGEIWKILSVYILAVVVVTYFLFFHKFVKAKIASRKVLDAKDNSEVNPEIIFKDIDENKKGEK